jgi:cysteinyl-tRNA synthetase
MGDPFLHLGRCRPIAASNVGADHDPPVHHRNEIAQTPACYGTHLANFWMHGRFLQLGDSKMSKSAGGFLRLQSLVDRGYDPVAYATGYSIT